MNGPNGRAPGVVRLPEPVDEVRGRARFVRTRRARRRPRPTPVPSRTCAGHPGRTGRASVQNVRQAQSVASQPWMVARRSSVSGRTRGAGPAKAGFADEREPVRRDDGDEERGEREQLHGDRGEERDQREIECLQGTVAGEVRTNPPGEQRRAEGEAGSPPEVDAAEECRGRYQQQDERDDRPAITRRRWSARVRCRSSSCSGSRSSASSNTCSGSDRRGSALRR